MVRTHKIQLKVNNKQSTLLSKTCGCNRFAYNWMLNKSNELYKRGEKYNKFQLKREFNQFKKTLPFIKEVNAHAVVNDAIDRLSNSFGRFFKKFSKFPKFHSKKKNHGSFSLTGSEIKYDSENQKVYLCKLGWLKLTEKVRFTYSKIYKITVTRHADKWFVSFCLEVEDNRKCENQAFSVGIDLGVKNNITCSDGFVIENPRILNHYSRRLRKLNRQLSRRVRGGKNWWKSVYALRKLYYKISNVRKDLIHKFTTKITRKYGIVCLEDLNVKGMVKNHKLAKHILDVSFGEIERQIKYKALEVRHVDRFYPSSKTCSSCGFVKQDLKLSDRKFICPSCGLNMDRDLNASINIRDNAVSSTVNACAVDLGSKTSSRQELNIKSV